MARFIANVPINPTALDTLFANADASIVPAASSGNDKIVGANVAAPGDILAGLGGNDTIQGRLGADHIDGGTGTDTAVYVEKTVGISLTLAAGAGTAIQKTGVGGALGGLATGGVNEDRVKNVENVTAGAGHDFVSGNALANVILGNRGNDTLRGFAGNDTLTGGAGKDYLDGGVGTDTAVYVEKTVGISLTLADGAGTAVQKTGVGGALGGLATGGVNEDSVKFVENVTAGAGNDFISGNALANVILGNNGNDTLYGFGGNDNLQGGAGNDYLNDQEGADTFTGGAGKDVLIGYGKGDDTAVYSEKTVGISVTFATPGLGIQKSGVTGTLGGKAVGGVNEDSIRNIGNITAGSGNDFITGDRYANVILGNNGNDTLNGRVGDDTLNGGGGNDFLIGGPGDPGGARFDYDTLTGGPGHDTYGYAAVGFGSDSPTGRRADVITDFDDDGNDKIDLSALDGTLTYIGGLAFSGTNQVRINDIGGPDLIVQVSANLFAHAVMEIRLKNTTFASMEATDFLLV